MKKILVLGLAVLLLSLFFVSCGDDVPDFEGTWTKSGITIELKGNTFESSVNDQVLMKGTFTYTNTVFTITTSQSWNGTAVVPMVETITATYSISGNTMTISGAPAVYEMNGNWTRK